MGSQKKISSWQEFATDLRQHIHVFFGHYLCVLPLTGSGWRRNITKRAEFPCPRRSLQTGSFFQSPNLDCSLYGPPGYPFINFGAGAPMPSPMHKPTSKSAPAAQSEAARQAAESVLDHLNEITAAFQALGPAHAHHIHVLFSELYANSTNNWLRALRGESGVEYHYQFIVEFFELYRVHVLDQLNHPLGDIAPHWRFYHKLARRLTINSPVTLHLLLISSAVRAHIRFDQGEAMHSVERRLKPLSTRFHAEQARLFGIISDEAFSQTAIDYIDAHRARRSGWRWYVLTMYRFCLFLLKPIWLATFQAWRRRGYQDRMSNDRS